MKINKFVIDVAYLLIFAQGDAYKVLIFKKCVDSQSYNKAILCFFRYRVSLKSVDGREQQVEH